MDIAALPRISLASAEPGDLYITPYGTAYVITHAAPFLNSDRVYVQAETLISDGGFSGYASGYARHTGIRYQDGEYSDQLADRVRTAIMGRPIA